MQTLMAAAEEAVPVTNNANIPIAAGAGERAENQLIRMAAQDMPLLAEKEVALEEMSQAEAEGMGPEAAIGFPPLAEAVQARGEEGMPHGGGCFAKEEGVDGSVGSAHEEMPTLSGEEAIEVGQFLERSEEVMPPEASQFPPEVWRDATRGAAIPRHLREDRLARSEDEAKRLKEECDHCKSASPLGQSNVMISARKWHGRGLRSAG
jgi:hypothetical protein